MKINKKNVLYFLLTVLIVFIILDRIVHNINYEKLKVNFPENFTPLSNIKEEQILRNEDEHYSKKIPYTLFRTYIDKEKAKKFSEARKITLDKNPYLKEVFFSDKDIEKFIKEKYTDQVYNAYQKINPIYGPAKADFFRYLVVYYYGGMYLDIKSYAHKNIKHLFDNTDKLIISKGRKYNYNPNSFGIIPTFKNNYDWSLFSGVDCGEYNNWHFIAPARHPILGNVIRQIVHNIENAKTKYNYGEYSVLALTGPILFSRVIAKYGNENNLLVMEPKYNNTVKYNYIDHKTGNKNHYSKLEDKQVVLS
jgi:inositol phosphorylceramide mannosyltransferase catalytic subunit